MLLFELFNPNLELNNEVKDVLSQYTYLRYSILDGDALQVVFAKDTRLSYINKILVGFRFEVVEETPVKIKVLGRKTVDTFKDFKQKPVIGNIEEIDLPGLNIRAIKAKVDTGATTSSLHVSYVKIDSAKKTVTFIPLDKKFPQYKGQKFTYPLQEQVRVQSSNGEEEVRALIKLKITLNGDKMETYFSLTDREKLEYPILLGKDVLSGYLIDPTSIH